MGKTLVTGATGFLGSHLIGLLDRQSLRVLVRESRPEGDIEVVEGTVVDQGAVEKAVDGVERIYHLAGTSPAKSPAILTTYGSSTASTSRGRPRFAEPPRPPE